MPRAEGGLSLPVLSTLYKQQQSSRLVIFRSSRNECLRFLEANTIYHHKGKFSAISVVNDVQSHNTACSKQQLKAKVSQHILAEDYTVCREHLTKLRVQGQLFRMDCDLSYWSEAVSSLPDREMRFAYNAAFDTLPTDTNLALWYKGQVSAQCKLCVFPTQSLKHVLNKCVEALRQHRFDSRHDSITIPYLQLHR